MLTLKQARESLPNKGKDLTDEEVTKIRDEMYHLANIIFEKWLVERNEKKQSKQNQTSPSPEKLS